MAFAWKGSESGGTLLLGAGVAGRSFAPPPPPSGGPQTVSATIVERSISGYAPDVVTIEATAANFPGVAAVTSIHDESVQKVDFIINWGDPTATYDYKTRSFGQSNNPNYDIGKRGSHCYAQPGTYTITVTARMWSG